MTLPPDPETGKCPLDYFVRSGDDCVPFLQIGALTHFVKTGDIYPHRVSSFSFLQKLIKSIIFFKTLNLKVYSRNS